MKMNILVGSMLLSASLCGQSFGGDLLHRLLGGRGCGASSSCCDTSVSDPSCGAEMAPCGTGCGTGPSCGAEMAAPCGPSCAPSCGAEIASCDPCGAPSCGVESSCCAPRTPILSKLKARLCGLKSKLSCKSACAPSCGAETACDPCNAGPSCGAEIAACDPCAAPSCDSGCGKKMFKGGLLAKIFKCKSSCDAAPSCDSCAAPSGCSSCASAPSGSSYGGTSVPAPMAAPAASPAPVVDPHAYMNTKRHVIQASSTRIR